MHMYPAYFKAWIDARKKPAFIAADSRDRLASEPLPDWLKSLSPPLTERL